MRGLCASGPSVSAAMIGTVPGSTVAKRPPMSRREASMTNLETSAARRETALPRREHRGFGYCNSIRIDFRITSAAALASARLPERLLPRQIHVPDLPSFSRKARQPTESRLPLRDSPFAFSSCTIVARMVFHHRLHPFWYWGSWQGKTRLLRMTASAGIASGHHTGTGWVVPTERQRAAVAYP